ncbi:MAG: TIM barrel protein [Planctomycetota bacterium]|jgi:hydroxypyruvate isomerase
MTILRHSAPDWCFFEGRGFEPADYYRRVRSVGCAAVELVEPSEWGAAREAGLPVLAIPGGAIREGLNRLENHRKLVPQITEKLALARENGISYVIIFSGNRAGMDDEQGLANCIEGTRKIAGAAEEFGVTLLFEMLNSFDHEDYQGDNPEFGFAVAKALESPAVKVLYDIYHMYRMGRDECSITADIRDNLDLIGHIHVAGAPGRGFPGDEQEIDYRGIIRAIHAAGYGGFIGHEFMPSGDPLEELAAAVALFESYAV